jgi:hypothetical protein
MLTIVCLDINPAWLNPFTRPKFATTLACWFLRHKFWSWHSALLMWVLIIPLMQAFLPASLWRIVNENWVFFMIPFDVNHPCACGKIKFERKSFSRDLVEHKTLVRSNKIISTRLTIWTNVMVVRKLLDRGSYVKKNCMAVWVIWQGDFNCQNTVSSWSTFNYWNWKRKEKKLLDLTPKETWFVVFT